MPAYRAALGLAPTARNSKPVLVRKSSHQTNDRGAEGEEQPEVHLHRGIEPGEQRGQLGALLDGLGDRVVAALALEQRVFRR